MAYIAKPTTLMKIWATAGVKETPADSKIQQGWVVELPPYQYDNWLENRQDTFIAHVNQVGIPVWDTATEYQGNKSYVQGSNGLIYKALQTSTNIDPVNPLNSTYWVRAFEDYGSVQVVQTALNNHLTNYSTLSGISNVTAARNNLSVYSKTESDDRFAPKTGNTAQTFNVADATSDSHAINRGQFLSLLNQATETSAGIAEIADQTEMNVGTDDSRIVTPKKGKATYLMRANNLSDLTNVAAARNNLGLTSTATTPLDDLLTKSGNLAGIANVTTARTNLGLGTIAVENAIDWLSKAGNLAGLSNVSTARNNLGLGNSATRNVGTTAGTVAAGDDSRIVNSVQKSTGVYAGLGLTGGGTLADNVTLYLGTPSTLSATTGNASTFQSHTHAIDINSWFGNRQLADEGWYIFPGGFCIQWGAVYSIPQDGQVTRSFPITFSNVFHVIGGKANATPVEGDGNACGAYSVSESQFVAFNDSNRYQNTVTWIALGTVNV